MVPDALVSPEHGYLAAIITVLNSSLFYLHSLYRRKRRNGSLAHEVEAQVERIMKLRQTQEALALQGNDFRMQAVEERLGDLITASDTMDRKLDALKDGIILILSDIKPELIKQLDFGGRR